MVDGDHRAVDDVEHLQARDVHVLPVAEIENVLLLASVFIALAEALLCADPAEKLRQLTAEVMKTAEQQVDALSARYTIRQIDHRLKRVGFKAKDLSTLKAGYGAEIAKVDPTSIFNESKATFEDRLRAHDLATVLAPYDNKGLIASASSVLGLKSPIELMEKMAQLLGDKEKGRKVRDAMTAVLPTILV